MKKTLKILISLLLIATVATSGYLYWQHSLRYPSTDDAYVQANIVHMATRINGSIQTLHIQDHQYVKKGQLLLELDPKPFQIALEKAQANVEQALQKVKAAESSVGTARSLLAERKAELINVQKDTERTLSLVKKRLASQSSGDKAIRQFKVAKATVMAAESQLKEAIDNLGQLGAANASVRAAKSALKKARLDLGYTKVTAPTNAYVANLHLRIGDKLAAYQKTFVLIENKHWWVNANFKETQLERIRPGQSATVIVDMYPNHSFKGTVVSISPGSGTAFSLLPAENATGNWIKVTQRFPVRVRIDQTDEKFPLRLGASAAVTIDTLHHD